MNWNKKVPYFIVVLNVFGLCQGYFEKCDQTITIAAGETKTLLSPGLAQGLAYAPGTPCRYTIVAPAYYQVRASCSLSLYGPSPKCPNQKFYFATNGRQDLSGSNYYCGVSKVAQTSQGNRMVLAYVSTEFSGHFTCSLSTVCDCGWAVSVNSRIVGGIETAVNEFPPMAGLFSMRRKNFFCGATIVSSKYVLTAARCLSTNISPPSMTTIVVGEHDTRTGAETNYTVGHSVKRFLPHPSFSFENYKSDLNDIGLVESKTTIEWSIAVAPVCLPFDSTSTDFSGKIVTATGWGTQDFGAPPSDVLLKVDLSVQSNSAPVCRATAPKIASSQLCTYTPDGEGKDTCQFDSGGPLFYRGSADPRLFLVGLLTHGIDCAAAFGSTNSRVTSFLPWIERVVGAEKLCHRKML